MIPFDMTQAQERLATLVEFDVDIYLQPEQEARVGQEKIPLWMKDFGYSQQGIVIPGREAEEVVRRQPKTCTPSRSATASRCSAT